MHAFPSDELASAITAFLLEIVLKERMFGSVNIYHNPDLQPGQRVWTNVLGEVLVATDIWEWVKENVPGTETLPPKSLS